MPLSGILNIRASTGPYVVSFDEIVKAHFAVDQAYGSEGGDDEQQELLKQLWKTFDEQERGRVLSSFFGEFGKSGAALTIQWEQRRLPPFHKQRPRLHVAMDLTTAGAAADLLSRYERLRVKADQLLAGGERQHVMRVIYDRLCRVIRIVDQMHALDRFKANAEFEDIDDVFVRGRIGVASVVAAGAPAKANSASARAAKRKATIDETNKRITNALTVANSEAAQAEELCNRAVRRAAMMAYFLGMVGGIALFTGLVVALGSMLQYVLPELIIYRFLTVFIAGAVGAIVSVMSRMSRGDSWLEYETARNYLSLLGMFRPLIGAIFGVALYFGIESGVLQFIKAPPTSNNTPLFFFFAFVAFLAGFSERWASDVLVPIKERELRNQPVDTTGAA